MNLCLRLFALIAFSVILLSNHSSLAAESCEGLFTSPLKVTLLAPSSAYYLLRQHYQNPSATSKSQAEASLKTFEATIHEALTERGINYEAHVFNHATLDINLTEFVISPKGSHPLNKMAQSLQRKLGSVVAFNPFTNMEFNLLASFRWTENKLLISKDAVLKGFTHIDAHEAIHAHLLGQRLGKLEFLPKAPVAIHMASKTGIDGRDGRYSHFMSFEEMVTYAYDLTYAAKQTVPFLNKKETSDYIKNINQTQGMLGNLFEVSNNVDLATQKAQVLLEQQKFSLSQENGEQVLVLKTPDEDFQMNIFIPKSNLLSPEAFAAKQLLNANALAKFTQSYFESLRGASEEVFLQKARAFRSAQKHFIEGL